MSTAAASAACHVLVVDDHPVVRHGMTSLLQREPWVGDVSQAGTAAQAIRLAAERPPDLAVVDLVLPDGHGTDVIRQLATTAPGCATLVLTMTDDAATVRSALDAGANGYVLKDATPEMIAAAARTVQAGGKVFGPKVSHGTAVADRPPAPFDALTPRELRLLRMLANGHSNRKIATDLSIAEKTVRNQVSTMLARLGAADRVEAVLLAHRCGLVS
jgi:DNA-binding NarL/FixJ family response regulator